MSRPRRTLKLPKMHDTDAVYLKQLRGIKLNRRDRRILNAGKRKDSNHA